jgi:hypothetical protein
VSGRRTRITVDTLVATASVLAGATLEDRVQVRDGQQPELLSDRLRAGLALPPGSGAPRYYYGCLDFLPFHADGREGFQLLEFNGTGMGGLTNLPWAITDEILGELARMPARLAVDAPLVVMPLSLEAKRGLVHERVLVAQALADGLRDGCGAGRIWLCRGVDGEVAPHGPVVALGYPRTVKAALQARDGRLVLAGRTVDAAVRDLFCQHVTDRHAGELADGAFHPVNGLFAVCASKPRTYALYNEFLAAGAANELIRRPVAHGSAGSREELIALVIDACARGLSLVIKPHASGAGRGVEFFIAGLHPSVIVARIDAAIAEAEHTQGGGLPRQIYPYAACELLDGLTIRGPDHPLHGNRYELRIVVHRAGDRLHVFPAVCKVAGVRFDPDAPAREMLLNTVSPGDTGGGGHLLPLCNRETLAAIGLTLAELEGLCDVSLRFVAHAIAADARRG